jgi:hypothetical protein
MINALESLVPACVSDAELTAFSHTADRPLASPRAAAQILDPFA